jgi:anti-sigma-K factor RskA
MTSTPPAPESWDELLAGYVLGDLSPAENAQVQALLEQHPERQRDLQVLQEVLALLPYALPETDTPPTDLRDRLLAAAEVAPPAPPTPTSPLTSAPKRQPPWRRWTIPAIAGIAIALLGWDSVQLRTRLAQTEQELAAQRSLVALLRQSDNRLMALRGMEKAPTASGSLVVNAGDRAAVLALQNLQNLPGDRVYRLWAIADGQKIGCADFRPDAEGNVFIKLDDDILMQADAVAITIEPTRNSGQPTSDPVIMGGTSL